METRETEIIREAMLSTVPTPIHQAELRKFVATVHEVLGVWRKNADAIDQQVVDFHYRRRMHFAEIATALFVSESSARRRWCRLLGWVTYLLEERVKSDEQLSSFACLIIENPEAFRLAVPAIMSAQKLGPETASAEVTALRRAVLTFGSHADAVHWLLLGCIDHGLIF